MNEVVFPHARLTYKASGLLSATRVDKFLARLREFEFVDRISSPETLEERLAEMESRIDFGMPIGDFGFDLLVFDSLAENQAGVSGFLEDGPREIREPLLDELNWLAGKLKATYDHGDPIPQ